MAPEDPLIYPEHYPPTDKWKKFFIGVRGLGPDLSFFRDLQRQQAGRADELMSAWRDPIERDIALEFGQLLHSTLGWPTPYFLPEDRWTVIGSGPTFEAVDYLGLGAAVIELERRRGVQLPNEFWESHAFETFGQVVSAVTALLPRV